MCWKVLIWLAGRLRWSDTYGRDAETLPVSSLRFCPSGHGKIFLQLENEAIFGALRQLNRPNIPYLDGMRCDLGLIGVGLVWRGSNNKRLRKAELFVLLCANAWLVQHPSGLTNILLHRMRVVGGLLDGALVWEEAKQWKKKVSFCFILFLCELATRTSSPTHHYINFPTKNSHHTIICFIPTLFWYTIISDEVRKVMRKARTFFAWLLWRMCVTYTLPTRPSHHSKWLHLNYCSTITCSSVTYLWL